MKDAIAITKVKIKEKLKTNLYCHQKMTNFGHHASSAGISMLILTSAVVGFIAFGSMISGAVQSGGITPFLTKWINSLILF